MTAVSSGTKFGAHRAPLQEKHFVLATASCDFLSLRERIEVREILLRCAFLFVK